MGDNPHDDAFFSEMLEDPARWNRLGACEWDVVGAEPGWLVYDLGCGVGLVGQEFVKRGARVIGVDPYCPPEKAVIEVRRHLLGKPLPVGWSKGDSVICTETGEHLPESDAEVLVYNCCKLAKNWIVWSAAQPGQEWLGHINLQRPAYWQEKFSRRGWRVDWIRTAHLQDLMVTRQAQHRYCRANFRVLRRSTCT